MSEVTLKTPLFLEEKTFESEQREGILIDNAPKMVEIDLNHPELQEFRIKTNVADPFIYSNSNYVGTDVRTATRASLELDFQHKMDKTRHIVDAMRLPEIIEIHVQNTTKRSPYARSEDFESVNRAIFYINQLSAPVFLELLKNLEMKK